MKNIYIKISCVMFTITAVIFFSCSAGFAKAVKDTEVSFFSTPDEADAAEQKAFDHAIEQSEKDMRAVEVAQQEVASAKQEVKDVAKAVAFADRQNDHQALLGAQEKLAVARTNLEVATTRADKALQAATSIKTATIVSMRGQKMDWTEIAKELGATTEALSLGRQAARQQQSLRDAKGVRSKEATTRSSKIGLSKALQSMRGTARDVKSGTSKTPGVLGGRGDKSLGLSRVSSKARSGSKESRSAKDQISQGGRGNISREVAGRVAIRTGNIPEALRSKMAARAKAARSARGARGKR